MQAYPHTNVMEAAFGAGCFWHVEHEFAKLPDVKATSGYMGGSTKSPTYEQVCTGRTGHAETVHLDFVPKTVPYERLLRTFWGMHNPMEKDRQGPDIGNQYRSVIFYYTSDQKKKALASKKMVEEALGKKVATEIVPAKTFWRAEACHQQYFKKYPGRACAMSAIDAVVKAVKKL